MLRQFLNSKIHRATVTDANLNYVGSITIDEEFLELSGIMEWEKVEILNINNGERFQTYVIKGKRGSKCFCLNGAAARKAQPGDKIIIVTYADLTPEEIIEKQKFQIETLKQENEFLRQIRRLERRYQPKKSPSKKNIK